MPSNQMLSPSLSPVNTKRAPSCSPPSGPSSLVPTPRTARRGGEDEGQDALDVHDWVRTVLIFLEKNGQEILQAICARYKIPYDKSITSIPIGTWEQVAYNAIFNPALPKSSGGDGMPMMLRDVKGVSDFQLRFLQDKQGIFKTTQVSARLSGVPFEIECRSCSYCGSCFSGRFMELDSTHQRAGGWKEITDKIHAGSYSWKGLKGWRLCVPCFTNYGQKGTMENTNRLSISKIVDASPMDLSIGSVLAKATPQLGPLRPQGPGSSITPGSLRDFLQNGIAPSKRFFESNEPASRPCKRKKSEARREEDCVEVFADNDWWDAHIIDRQGDHVRVHYVGGTADEDEWIPNWSERLRYAVPVPKATPRSTPQISAMREGDSRMSMPPCGAVAEEACCMMPPELNLAGNMGEEESEQQSAQSPEIMLVTDSMPELDLAREEEEDDSDLCVDEERILPTTIDVVKANLGEMEGLVELALNTSGRDLSFQWYEGNEAIPGACSSNLLLVNSGGVGGRIRCLVRNKYGATWIKCPVLLPAAPEEARQELDALNAPGFYRLACRCGHVREGLAQELCEEPCQCGAVCCGAVEKIITESFV